MHNLSSIYFVKHLYVFRAYLGPSSGGTTVCVQKLVLIILFTRLSVVLVGLCVCVCVCVCVYIYICTVFTRVIHSFNKIFKKLPVYYYYY